MYRRAPKKDEYKAVCERSGFIVNSSDIATEWTGKKVHKKFFEERHPGEMFRARADTSRPSWTRPVPASDTFTTRTVWEPTADPNGGEIPANATVSLASVTDDATIRYTDDGSTPSSTVGTVYSAPFAIATSTTIKAIAYLSTGEVSGVSTFVYTV